jgi:hypothetical protein
MAADGLQPLYDEPLQTSSSHPSSEMAHASQDESCILKLDYQNIEYIEPVDDTLLCPICKTPFHSPITTTCGHTFCAACINRALETQPTCPIDRQPINKTRDYRRLPLIIKDQLDRLQVKCPNKGCDYECSREHLEGHYERRCEFTQVRCPDPTCTKLLDRRDAIATKDCLHVDVACEFCDQAMTFPELTGHYNHECDSNFTECPDCDTPMVVRHRLAKHRTQNCPEGNTQCKWHTAGCKVADKRRIVQAHEQSGCSFEVVGRLMQQRVEDRKTIDELAARLTKVELAQSRRRERHIEHSSRAGRSPPVASSSRSAHTTTTNLPDITLNNNHMPLFPGPAAAADDSIAGGSPEDYMLARFERLETQLERFERLETQLEQVRQQAREIDTRQSHMIMQQATHFSEQLAEIGSKVGVVNMHMSWLMSLQRQSNAQQRAGSSAAAAAGGGSSGSGGMSSHGSGNSGGGGGGGARSGSSDDSGVRYLGESRRHSEGRPESLHRL